MKKHYKRVLTIAGSDPSGGAGISADLKTFSACGCYGMSAIVAVVDENTVGVTGVHPVPVDFVTGQIRSVLDDIGADAVKIGMLHLIGTYPGRAGNFGRLRHPQHRPRSGDGRHLRRSAPAGRSDRHAPRRAGTVCAGHHSEYPRSGDSARTQDRRTGGAAAGSTRTLLRTQSFRVAQSRTPARYRAYRRILQRRNRQSDPSALHAARHA